MINELLHLWDNIRHSIAQLIWTDVVDVLLLWIVLYCVIQLARHTRAMQVVKGAGALLVTAAVTRMMGLTGVTWLLNYLLGAGALLVVILFQPELRRALESIGRGSFFKRAGSLIQNEGNAPDLAWVGDEILRAMLALSKSRTGALIVVVSEPMEEVARTGTPLDALVSRAVLENIFVYGSPLHDGAALIFGDRVVAAACFLPLSEQVLDRSLGTRHRAALGITEQTGATVLVVSEETGDFSIARAGELQYAVDVTTLRRTLDGLFRRRETHSLSELFRWRPRHESKD